MGTAGMTPQFPAATPQAIGLSEGQRIVNTFADPPKTFTDLKRYPTWWVPWLLLSVFSYLLVFAVAQKVGFEQVSQNQLRLNRRQAERMEQMPPEQRARALQLSVTITKAISYCFPIVLLISLAVIAVVLMVTFNFGLGQEIGFPESMAVVTYAHLPGIIKGVLAAVSLYAGASPEGFNFENPLASNLGALIDVSEHPLLYRMGSAVDVFTIWVLILTGIGFACVSKLKRSTSLAVVFGWYALITLIGIGFAAAFS